MFWRRSKPDWLIDPDNVAFGSVVENGGRNLSRSHVRVKYRHEPGLRLVSLVNFAKRCREDIRGGQPLGIEHLLVAPIIKQRHAQFFDRLTDWRPASRRAFRRSPAAQRRVLLDP
jgi:hypothetical protein